MSAFGVVTGARPRDTSAGILVDVERLRAEARHGTNGTNRASTRLRMSCNRSYTMPSSEDSDYAKHEGNRVAPGVVVLVEPQISQHLSRTELRRALQCSLHATRPSARLLAKLFCEDR